MTMRTRVLLPLVAVSLLAGAPLPAAASEPVAVIVDPQNPRSDISAEELKSIYLGRRREWPDGQRIVALDLPAGSAASDAFARGGLGMDPRDLDQFWVEAKVRGGVSQPKEVPTAGAVAKLVSRIRGAVGYVPLSQVDGSVKVLAVDGVLPGKPGYRLAR